MLPGFGLGTPGSWMFLGDNSSGPESGVAWPRIFLVWPNSRYIRRW